MIPAEPLFGNNLQVTARPEAGSRPIWRLDLQCELLQNGTQVGIDHSGN
jgi:hypothetical protein